MWSCTIHDTISGEKLGDVVPAGGSFERTPGAGRGEHTFNLLDDITGLPRSVARSLFVPNASTLVIAWDGSPLYAGVVIDPSYSRTGGSLSVKHVDVRELFKHRLTFGVSTFTGGDLATSGKGLSGLARAILNRGFNDWGETWRLPIDLPADTSGSYSLDVKRWEWATIESLLRRVEKMGAVIDFDPYYTTNGDLRYAARVASRLPGAGSEYTITAEHTPITNLQYGMSGNSQLSGCFYMGMGTEADMKWGEAGFISGPRIPVRDAARSAKDEDSVTKLNQMALHDLTINRAPHEYWSFDVTIQEGVNPQYWKPGGRPRLHSWGDAFIPDGAHDLVVTGLSADWGSLVLKPEVEAL